MNASNYNLYNKSTSRQPAAVLFSFDEIVRYESIKKQEAHHKVGLGETPRRLIRKRCRYSSLEKFEDAFDTELDLVQTKPSDAAFSAFRRSSINADNAGRKQLVTSYPVWL